MHKLHAFGNQLRHRREFHEHNNNYRRIHA